MSVPTRDRCQAITPTKPGEMAGNTQMAQSLSAHVEHGVVRRPDDHRIALAERGVVHGKLAPFFRSDADVVHAVLLEKLGGVGIIREDSVEIALLGRVVEA